ncbi:glutaredoxin [Nannocystaceae bacterium ST9]
MIPDYAFEVPGFPLPSELAASVVVYLTPWCPYCRMARRLLDARGIAYEFVDVSGDDPARAWLFEASGQSTVPQIFVKGESVGGYTELAELDRSGELARRLAS